MESAGEPVNPYSSPSRLPVGELVLAGPQDQAIAQLVRKGLLYRRIHLEAPIEATLEYSGLGLFDRVWVNGKLVAKRLPWVWLTDSFEFELPTERGMLSCELKLEFSRFARLVDVELLLDGKLVYRESGRREPSPDDTAGEHREATTS